MIFFKIIVVRAIKILKKIEEVINLQIKKIPDKLNNVAINVSKLFMKLTEKPIFKKKLIISNKNDGELLFTKKNKLVVSV